MKLKEYRKSKGYTQQQVSEKAGITRVFLSLVENGAPCRMRIAKKISDAVHYDLGYEELNKMFPSLKNMTVKESKKLAEQLNIEFDKENLF